MPGWIFGVTCIPYGVAGGFCAFTMPLLLRSAGIPVEDIGWFTAATMAPTVLQFLYAPIVDFGLRRRAWLILLAVLGAACLLGALLVPLPSGALRFLALAVAGQWLTGLISSCNGALMATTLTAAGRSAAAGWYMAGNLGGGALGAGVTMSLAQHQPRVVTGLCTAAMIIVPSLAALLIPEAPRPRSGLGAALRALVSEVVATARSRAGWTGLLFCASPVGTAALINQFPALGVDYHASPSLVALVTGYLSGLVSAIGSLAGGAIAGRVDRRRAYLMCGVLTAACAAAMALAPLSPTTFVVGATVYLFLSGGCYAVFSVVVLDAIGVVGASAGTQYTLFTAAGNLAILYTGWLDTRLHGRLGPAGPLATDAALNLAGVLLLSLLLRFLPPPRTAEVSASG